MLLERQPPFITRRKPRGRFAVGLRYERKAQEMLRARFPGTYLAGPWFEFVDRTGRRWCQPDGLIIWKEREHIRIVEIKYQHTERAWWQLRQLYDPVIRAAFPDYETSLLQVVHWHDPAVSFPENYDLLKDCEGQLPMNRIGTHIWNPNRG